MRRLMWSSILLVSLAGLGLFGASFGWVRARLSGRSAIEARRAKTLADIQHFCSSCHQFPPPDCLPRYMWSFVIEKMYELWALRQSQPQQPTPPMEEVISFYTTLSPSDLPLSGSTTGSSSSPIHFERHPLSLEGFPPYPAVANLNFVRLSEDGPMELLVCDMRHGIVATVDPGDLSQPPRILARIPHPCHTQVVDLDRDGIRDILVADLGLFLDDDTDKGTAVWLRGQSDGSYEPVVLLSGVGRVSDVRAADFDRDGDLDIVVAIFGHFDTGKLLYLENCTSDYSHPEFLPAVLDSRTGSIHVPAADLDRNGTLDFVALFAQEHETIVAFLNSGLGSFERQPLFTGEHPNIGSTGIELMDLDGDGDTDVLYTNGDAFGKPPVILKPYHGISWLENRGRYPFTYHCLTNMPGVHRADVADLDGDGDLDIAACAFIRSFDPDWPVAELMESIIWLEQTAPGQFQRYALETRLCRHVCLDLADYDGDGDLDMAVGNFIMVETDKPCETWLTLFENRSR